jgi:hypothetical protein
MDRNAARISVVVIVPVPSPVAIVGAIMAVAIVVGEIVGAVIIARPPHVAVGIAARIVPVDGCTGRVIRIPMTVVVPVMGLRCRRSAAHMIVIISGVAAAVVVAIVMCGSGPAPRRQARADGKN